VESSDERRSHRARHREAKRDARCEPRSVPRGVIRRQCDVDEEKRRGDHELPTEYRDAAPAPLGEKAEPETEDDACTPRAHWHRRAEKLERPLQISVTGTLPYPRECMSEARRTRCQRARERPRHEQDADDPGDAHPYLRRPPPALRKVVGTAAGRNRVRAHGPRRTRRPGNAAAPAGARPAAEAEAGPLWVC
jgi:hypothetical protein